MNAVKGKDDIPLAFVIREDAVPQPNQVFQSEHHRLIAITPLQGLEYEEDNGRVFDLLKSWTINSHAWTWMRAYNNVRNGRQAWLALVQHFEGDAQRDRVKDQAYTSIASAKYYGEKKRFTFETYVTIHQYAYADLEQSGEIILEEKRVRDLLSNIKDNSPAANAAKGTILTTPTLRNSFANAVTHLSTTLQLGQAMQDNHNISSTKTQGQGSSYVHMLVVEAVSVTVEAGVVEVETEVGTSTLVIIPRSNGESYLQKIKSACMMGDKSPLKISQAQDGRQTAAVTTDGQ